MLRTAVPTIFDVSEPSSSKTSSCVGEKRRRSEYQTVKDRKSLVQEAVKQHDENKVKTVEVQTVGIKCKTVGVQTMNKPANISIPTSPITTVSVGTQTDFEDYEHDNIAHINTEYSDVNISIAESLESNVDTELNSSIVSEYVPEEESTDSDEQLSNNEDAVIPENNSAFIVFWSELCVLLRRCMFSTCIY